MTVTQPTTTTTPPQIVQGCQEVCMIWTRVKLLQAPVGFIQTWTNLTLKGQEAKEQNRDFIEVINRITAACF